jgi:hypothetical protein
MKAAVAISFSLFLFGLGYVFVTPPFQVADEINHFLRAYQLSTGRPVTWRNGRIGGEFPNEIVRATEAFSHLPFHSGNRASRAQWRAAWNAGPAAGDTFCDLFNTVVYSPVPYVPQTIGVTVGR